VIDDHISPLLEQVEAALDKLHVCLGHARLYGHDHPRTLQEIEVTLDLLHPVLHETGNLELVTQPDGLYWDGVLARAEAEDHSGLGRLLHREGIAAISFEAGLPPEEMAVLLGVLRVNLSLPKHEEETLDSLLWQRSFTHIRYRAVHSLAEAEALSGGLGHGHGGDVVDDLLEYRPGATSADGRPRRLSEDAITRAVAGSDLDDLGPKADRALKGLPDGDWDRLFSEESEDREAMAKMRADLERERPGDLAASMFYVLLQAAAEGRPELHTPKALSLASALLHHLAACAELQGLGRILAERPQFAAAPRMLSAPSYAHVAGYLTQALDSNSLLRVLLRIQPGPDLDLPGLDQLLISLPDEGLAALVQAAVDDPDVARREVLFEAMGRTVQSRVERFVAGTERVTAERALATVHLLRALNSERGKEGRKALLKHANPRVRAAAAAWYSDDLPDSDADALLDALMDRDREVRTAAAAALKTQRPFRAVAFFRKVFAVEMETLDPTHRKEICVACGHICGERGMELLGPLFEAQAAAKGRDRSGASLEAAAFGLAAVGSVTALAVLKKGAGGWNRARKAACRAALASMGAGA
jgi:hypothetical protein